MALFSRRKKQQPVDLDVEAAIAARPGFSDIADDTNVSLAMYFGGQALNTMIDAFSAKEDITKYDWRRKTAIENYENYPEEISQQYIESIKKAGKIIRTFTDKTDSAENVFLDVNYREWFDKEFSVMSLILPEIYIRIALPEMDDDDKEKIRSKADEKEVGLTPDMHIIYPQFVQNLVIDKHGNIEQITIKCGENIFEIYDDVNVYRIEVVAHEKEAKATIKETKTHGFTACPFVRAIWRENKTYQGEPKPGQAMMHSIIKRSKGALTLMSMLAESIHFHLYPKEAVGEMTAKNILEQGQGADKLTVVGKDAQGNSEPFPQYIETSTGEIEVLERINYERIPKIIYHRARLRDRYTEKAQSGIAKMFDMVPEIAVLQEIADFWKKADVKIVNFLAEGFKIKDPQPRVEYPKTFQVKSTAELLQEQAEFTQIMDKSSLPQSKTANQIGSLRMYKQMYPDLTDEEYATIEKEIATWTPPATPTFSGSAAPNLPRTIIAEEAVES